MTAIAPNSKTLPAKLRGSVLPGLQQLRQHLIPISRRRDRKASAPDPPAHQVSAFDGGQLAQPGHRQTVTIGTLVPMQLRQCLIELLALRTGPGSMGNTLKQSRPALLELCQHPVTQVITIVDFTGVAGVLYPAQSRLLRYLLQPVATDVKPGTKQRTPAQGPTRRYSRQTSDARAPKHAKQNGFGLVIAMVPHQQQVPGGKKIPEHRIPGLPCGLFQSASTGVAHRHSHANDAQLHAQGATELPAKLLGLRVVGLKLMIDMERCYGRMACSHNIQQQGGIESAAECNPEAGKRGELADWPEQVPGPVGGTGGVTGRLHIWSGARNDDLPVHSTATGRAHQHPERA